MLYMIWNYSDQTRFTFSKRISLEVCSLCPKLYLNWIEGKGKVIPVPN